MFHWEIEGQVATLKREGEYEEALVLVMNCLDFTEQQASTNGRHLYPWPYEQAAIIFRKLKKYDAEVEVLERFLLKQSSFDIPFNKLSDRLKKAYVLAGQGEECSANKFMKRGLIVDVETTGLSLQDEIIEFGGVLFLYSQLSGEILQIEETYTGLREPSIEISEGAAAVNGITLEMVRGKQLDEQCISRLFSSADIIIAHNASFDRRFISRLYPNTAQKSWYCSMNGIAWKEKGHQSKGLRQLSGSYNITSEQAHRGLEDAMTALSLLRCVDGQSGQPHLFELLRYGPMSSSYSETKSEEAPTSTSRVEIRVSISELMMQAEQQLALKVEIPPIRIQEEQPSAPIEEVKQSPQKSFWRRLLGL